MIFLEDLEAQVGLSLSHNRSPLAVEHVLDYVGAIQRACVHLFLTQTRLMTNGTAIYADQFGWFWGVCLGRRSYGSPGQVVSGKEFFNFSFDTMSWD